MVEQVGHVFISYAAADHEIAKRIAETLEDNGIHVWTAHNLKAGDDIVEIISEALRKAGSAIVLLSPGSIGSPSVASEYRTVLSQNKRVFPVMVEPVAENKIPLRLQALNMIDLTRDFDAGMARLIDAIQKGVTVDQDVPQPVSKHSRVAVQLEIDPANFDADELKKIVITLADAGVEDIKIVESKDG